MRSLTLVPYASVTVKTDVPATVAQLPRSSAAPSSPASTSRRSTCAATRTATSAAQLAGHRRRDQPERAQARRASAASRQGTIVGKERHRARLRPLPARPSTAPSASRSTRSGGRRARRSRARRRCPGRALQHVARPRPPAHRPGASSTRRSPRARHGGRVRRARPAQRRGPRDGLEPVLRPGGPRRADHPEAPRAAVRRRRRLAAVQPRDRRPLSDRLDVQADHRVRRARARASSRRARRSTTRAASRSAPRSSRSATPGKAVNGTLSLRARDPGLLRRLLLHARPRPQPARGPAAAEAGPTASGFGRDDGHRPAGRGPRPRARPRAGAREVGERERRCRKRSHITCRLVGCGISDMRPWTVGDNVNLAVGQGDLQATPLQMAVAYGAIEQRRHASCARTSALDGRGRRAAACCSRSIRAAARHVKIDPGARAGDHATGLHAAASGAGRHVGRRLQGLDRRTASRSTARPARRERHGQQRPVLVRRLRAATSARPIVVAVHVEDGGFGAEAAAPAARLMLVAVVRRQKKLSRRQLARPMSAHRTIADPRRRATRHARPRRARRACALPFDPVLLLAVARALRLLAASTIARAHRRRHRRRSPHYYVTRQAIYFAVGAGPRAGALARRLLAAARAQVRASTAC